MLKRMTTFLVLVLGMMLAINAVAEEKASAEAAPAKVAEEAAEAAEHEFPWFSIAPVFGFGYMGEADLELLGGVTRTMPSRPGFDMRLHLDMGGDGGAFEIVPFIKLERGDADMNAYGVELNWVYRMHFRRVYPHIGLGIHLGWLTADNIDWGMEIMGRLPIGATWYMIDAIGFVMELGFMWGGTGYQSDLFLDTEFGTHWGFDISAGIRWP